MHKESPVLPVTPHSTAPQPEGAARPAKKNAPTVDRCICNKGKQCVTHSVSAIVLSVLHCPIQVKMLADGVYD